MCSSNIPCVKKNDELKKNLSVTLLSFLNVCKFHAIRSKYFDFYFPVVEMIGDNTMTGNGIQIWDPKKVTKQRISIAKNDSFMTKRYF